MATIQQLNLELIRLSAELEKSIVELEIKAVDYAQKESAYRKAKALSFLTAEGKTVKDREMQVDHECEVERQQAYIADALNKACTLKVKSLMAQLSALQSIAAGTRAELESLGTPEADHHFDSDDDDTNFIHY